MMEPRLKFKKKFGTVDPWRQLESEILRNNFILTRNHSLTCSSLGSE